MAWKRTLILIGAVAVGLAVFPLLRNAYFWSKVPYSDSSMRRAYMSMWAVEEGDPDLLLLAVHGSGAWSSYVGSMEDLLSTLEKRFSGYSSGNGRADLKEDLLYAQGVFLRFTIDQLEMSTNLEQGEVAVMGQPGEVIAWCSENPLYVRFSDWSKEQYIRRVGHRLPQVLPETLYLSKAAHSAETFEPITRSDLCDAIDWEDLAFDGEALLGMYPNNQWPASIYTISEEWSFSIMTICSNRLVLRHGIGDEPEWTFEMSYGLSDTFTNQVQRLLEEDP